jgi:hypothetical protein
MASIVDLVRPNAAFDPETIAVLSAALDEAWNRLLQSGSECTRPAYARLCARSLRGASSIWRNGAPGIKKSLPMVLFVFLLRTIDLSARHRQGSSGTAVAPAALPELRLQAVDTARRCRNNCLVYFWK